MLAKLGSALWWLWRDSPKERNAIIDQSAGWQLPLVGFRSYRAVPVEPSSAPPGWMDEAGRHTLVGNYMAISQAFVERQGEAVQVNLPPIGPVDDSMQRAAALQAALAASLTSMQTLPKGG